MNTNDIKKMFIPQLDGRALDFIKIAAAICMVVDHVNSLLWHEAVPEMMLIGRTTFPLFCYAVAIAVHKTDESGGGLVILEKYGRRLLFLALLVEPISLLTRDIPCANVLFTLGFGAIFAGFSRQMKDWQVYLCFLLAAASMASTAWLPVEFGIAGIALPAAILMVWRNRRFAWPFLFLILATINTSGYGEDIAEMSNVYAHLLGVGLMLIAETFLPLILLNFAKELPQDGRYLSKYALHIFYPGHLLILWAIGRFYLGVS